jgi:Tol biopolymer transport system component
LRATSLFYIQGSRWPISTVERCRLFGQLPSTPRIERVGTSRQELGKWSDDVSPDGGLLLFHNTSPRGYDIGTLALAQGDQMKEFLATPFNEVQGRFSPNQRWVAYASDESGRFEVYVRPFPSASERIVISTGGGMQPEWRRDGKELFYLSADRKIMAVPVTTGAERFTAGTAQALFAVEVGEASAPYPGDYAVSGDGQRFLVNSVVNELTRETLTVQTNWTSTLEK